VAEGRDRDTVNARRIKNRCARGHRNSYAIDRQLNLGSRRGTHAAPRLGKQTPAEQRRAERCSSTTSGKCLNTEAMGTGTTCPKPQMEVNFMAVESSSSS